MLLSPPNSCSPLSAPSALRECCVLYARGISISFPARIFSQKTSKTNLPSNIHACTLLGTESGLAVILLLQNKLLKEEEEEEEEEEGVNLTTPRAAWSGPLSRQPPT